MIGFLTGRFRPLRVAAIGRWTSVPWNDRLIARAALPSLEPYASAAEEGVTELVDLKRGNAVTASLKGATVVFVYLLPKGNRKISRKLMRELSPGTAVITYMFRLPAEDWDEYLEETGSMSSTRERSKPGMDLSGINKMFLYRVPEEKPEWCKAGGATWVGSRRMAAMAAATTAVAAVVLRIFWKR